MVEIFSSVKTIHPRGIHPSAIISKDAQIAEGVAIGAYTVIEEGVIIGKDTIIYGHCYIGHHVKVGSKSLIYPHVSLREYVEIGNNVIINNGTVIGSDGFGYTTISAVHQRIPQIGIVVVEDDVDIGANVTIDRARFDKTVIGRGTKIDNLVHIAHNVITGENCLIVAQVGISGSTVLGKNVTLAGQAGLVGHITIGDNAIVGAQGGVTKSVAANTFVSGYPARPQKEAMKVNACVHNLPKLYEIIKELKQKILQLEEKLIKDK